MSLALPVRLFLRSTCLAAAALLLVSVGISPAIAKKPEPFKSRVVGTWDNVFAALPTANGPGQANFSAQSQTSHLGNAAQHGTLSLYPSSPTDIVIPGDGNVTITAANGDTLTFKYQGLLNALTGEGQGTFTFTGGTGRFANATGSGAFYAQIDLSVPTNQSLTVILDGGINY